VNTRPTFRRFSYHCRSCAYDVSTTLADGIATCPECGSHITFVSCARTIEATPRLLRLALYVSMAINLIGPYLAMSILEHDPELSKAVIALPPVIFFLFWLTLEDWLRTPGPLRASLGPTLAIVMSGGGFGVGFSLMMGAQVG